MKRIRLTFVVVFVLVAVFSAFGCQKKQGEPVITEMPPMPIVTPAAEEKKEEVKEEKKKESPKIEEEKVVDAFVLGNNEDYSRLTGLPLDKEKIKRRPVAVMINNLKPAVPQSGLLDAAVVYEAPVEGYITRFMAIFEDWDKIQKIGSIRSARTYYVRFAAEFDAYLVHVGEAYNARKLLSSSNSITESGDGTIFRDKSGKAPHNAFTSGEKLTHFFEKNTKLRSRISDEALKTSMFLFADQDEDMKKAANVKSANSIDLSGVYNVNKPSFVYDSKTKLYKRHQYGGLSKDLNHNEDLAFKNVVIQFTSGSVFDKKGRWNINETGGGDAYYLTNGKIKDAKWSFKNGRTHYYDSLTGEEIAFNRGKTWICIAINNRKSKLVIN